MLFPIPNRRAYTRTSIEALPPGKMGCYGLYTRSAWVYIGKGDIRVRLVDHLNGDNPCITKASPTSFSFIVTRNYDAEEVRLQSAVSTLCNKRVG
jgi:hypothetical protein